MSVFADIITSEEPRQEIRGERLATLVGELWGRGLVSTPLTVKAIVVTKTENGADWDYEYGEDKELMPIPAGLRP